MGGVATRSQRVGGGGLGQVGVWVDSRSGLGCCLFWGGGAVLVVSGGSIDREGGQRRLGMKRFESSRINNSGDERQWTSPGGRIVSVCIGLKQPFAGQAEGGL